MGRIGGGFKPAILEGEEKGACVGRGVVEEAGGGRGEEVEDDDDDGRFDHISFDLLDFDILWMNE